MTFPVDWIVPDWPAPERVHAVITTRAGGVSRGPYASFNLGELTDDDPQCVRENKRRLDALLPGAARWLRQVHGARVVDAESVCGVVEADAAIARRDAVVCAIKIADCMPVLLCDRTGEAVGVAHAGWRGLAHGVLENTVAAMQVDPRTLIAYLGPAIGPEAFEVGADVYDAFCAADTRATQAFRPVRAGKWLADLFMLARQRLICAGVTHIYGGGSCTVSDPGRFFSHRRDRITGRMAALIWLGEH